MTIRPVRASDAAEWLRMRMALWPDSEPDKEAGEIAHFLADPPRPALGALHAAFVCERPEDGLCGMVETSVRSYADGCATAPIGYLEAWYVDPDARNRGVGRALVAVAEAWARERGCREMASDADLDNTVSQAAHGRLGYRETGRAVQFCKALDPLPVMSAGEQVALREGHGMAQQYVRIYADPFSESHFEDLQVAFSPIDTASPAPPIHASPFTPAAQFALIRCPAGWYEDRHPAPRRQFLFHLAGEMEVEVSDGEVWRFGSESITLVEATTGKGQAARVVGTEEVLLAIVELPD